MEPFSTLLALCAGNSPVPVNSPHKGQWRRALMFSLICARMNDWVNNPEAGDLRRHRGHYDVTVMHHATEWRPSRFWKEKLIWYRSRWFKAQQNTFLLNQNFSGKFVSKVEPHPLIWCKLLLCGLLANDMNLGHHGKLIKFQDCSWE